jgi:class 3 adenylate cyclase/tetratricopeptide (TPR) repeat protein
MRCPVCQSPTIAGAKFCAACGEQLPPVCPRCGAAVRLGDRFCGECGQPQRSPAAAPAEFASPRAYTPRHLVEKILTSRSALEGERKQVTVLFCDIVGSTGVADRIGPEAMHGLLTQFFGLALGEIHRYEGTVNQFLGDGFMALFGAPIAHEDHARRAVLAAVGVRRALADRRGELGTGVDALAVRMGLNTGPVVVGKIGDNLRMDYTAVGDTTNMAARLEQVAEPGAILLSEVTHRLVHGEIRVETVGPIEVKGKRDPVTVHKLLGFEPRRSPLRGLGRRPLSQFVGREREAHVLGDLLARAEQGQGQVVAVAGEPGVGKSRLVYEFRQQLRGRQVTFLEGRCLSYGGAIPYLPLLDIARQNCGIADSDTPAEVAAKAERSLSEVGLSAHDWLPYLLQLLGVKEGTERLALLAPETIKARTFDLLRQLSVAGSRLRPAVFVIEDLHWIDNTSEEYLASLVDSIPRAAIFLLCTFRPGPWPAWMGRSYVTHIVLRPLTSRDSQTLLHSIVETNRLPDPVERVILDKSDGNPFFLEELARAVGEQRELREPVAVPDTVQGVLQARIDRLPDVAKRILQAAAVIGREVPLALLRAIWTDGIPLEPHLAELKRLEFLYERAGTLEPVLVFKHALTQDVAYESLLTPHRQALHGAAGAALERLSPDRLEEGYELLAYHYQRSTDTGKAVEYLALANQKAARANAMVEAKAYFDEAMKRLETLPDTPDNQRRRVALVVDQIIMFQLLLQLPEYHALLMRCEPAAVELGDPGLLGVLYARLGHCEWGFGEIDRAIERAERGVALCEAAGNHADTAYAFNVLAWCRVLKGEYERALACVERTLEALARRFNLRWCAWGLTAASLANTSLGRWDRAVEKGERALALGEQYADASVVSLAAWILATAHGYKGDLVRARSHAELAVEKAATFADRTWAEGVLAWIRARTGEPDHGVEVLQRVVVLCRAIPWAPGEFFASLLGDAALEASEPERARATLEESVALSERCGLRFWLATVRRALGEMSLDADPASARTHLEASIDGLRSIGAENELSRALAARARLLRCEGRTADARQDLETALEIVERLGTLILPDRMRRDLEKLEISI